MSTQSGFITSNWAKARIDEMDATLTSLEGKAAELTAGAREKPTTSSLICIRRAMIFGTPSISRRKPTKPPGRA